MNKDSVIYPENSSSVNIQHLKPECSKCFGLCCVALYFSRQDGFPTDKSAGSPCPNLETDFRCAVHERLGVLGLKGCISYECFGAGQQVSQVTFEGQDWRRDPASADLMFDVFLIMRQLHEMSWYLSEALSLNETTPIKEAIREALYATQQITQFTPYALMAFNLSEHRTKINKLLDHTSKLVRSQLSCGNKTTFNADKKRKIPPDYFGKDLRKKDVRCADLRGACLIAANLEGVDLSGTDFIGADFRDTNLRGANLSKSIFVTQVQVNVAKGNANTQLPPWLSRPEHWF